MAAEVSQRRPLSVREAATRLSCTPSMVRSLVRRGELASIRLGRLLRVPADALDEFVALQRSGPTNADEWLDREVAEGRLPAKLPPERLALIAEVLATALREPAVRRRLEVGD
jgi:excisionase family DNA binding protein